MEETLGTPNRLDRTHGPLRIMTETGWWFGTWLLFCHWAESSQLTFIFFRGVGTVYHQPGNMIHPIWHFCCSIFWGTTMPYAPCCSILQMFAPGLRRQKVIDFRINNQRFWRWIHLHQRCVFFRITRPRPSRSCVGHTYNIDQYSKYLIEEPWRT